MYFAKVLILEIESLYSQNIAFVDKLETTTR